MGKWSSIRWNRARHHPEAKWPSRCYFVLRRQDQKIMIKEEVEGKAMKKSALDKYEVKESWVQFNTRNIDLVEAVVTLHLIKIGY